MVQTIRILLIESAVVIGLGLLLALLGPYGSYDAPLAERLIYWLAMGLGGLLLFRPTMTAASAAARMLDLPEAATWTAGCLIATLPMSLIVWFAAPQSPGRLPTASELLSTYTDVVVLAAAVTLVFWFLKKPSRSSAARPPAMAADPASVPAAARIRFLERLPAHLGRDLVALEMEDHYVRAHTAIGSTLVLMRMRDAVAELDGFEGVQVHRSWWVARSAVTAQVQEGRNVRLVLKNGLQAPVARTSVSTLQSLGWVQALAASRVG